jgi:hypothetical protein
MLSEEVVRQFSAIDDVVAIFKEAPSDEPGRRGERFAIVLRDTNDTEARQTVTAAAIAVREQSPDFAWDLYDHSENIDAATHICIWSKPRHGGVITPIGGETIAVRDLALRAMADLDGVVDVTCSPNEHIRRGEKCHVSVVVRTPLRAPDVNLLREVDRRATELRKAIPEIVEIQAAPELNFPPTSAKLDDPNDLYLELKAEIMRIVERYHFVVAAWFLPPARDNQASRDRRRPGVYIYGEDDARMIADLKKLDVAIATVSSPQAVPRDAKCLFNLVTRLVKAQAEGDAAAVERLKAQIMGGPTEVVGPAVPNPRPLTAPPGMVPTRGDPASHYVGCRWCGFRIPASTNPAYSERCPQCSAIQSATTIPTKSKEMPLISIFVNPGGSVFFEFVFAPPEPGRFDLSKVWRLRFDGVEEFDQHPMGKASAIPDCRLPGRGYASAPTLPHTSEGLAHIPDETL